MEKNDPNQFRFVDEADDNVRTTIRYIKKCLKVSLSEKNKEQEGEALSYIGLSYHKLGNYEQAKDYHEQHLQLAESLEDRKGKRRALCNLGCVYKATGDLAMALYYFEKAYEICKDRGDMKALGRVSNNMANIYEMLMDTEKAIEYHKERYEAASSVDDLHGKGKACVSLGALYLVAEDLEKSMFYYEELLGVLRAKLRIQDTLPDDLTDEDDDGWIDLHSITIPIEWACAKGVDQQTSEVGERDLQTNKRKKRVKKKGMPAKEKGNRKRLLKSPFKGHKKNKDTKKNQIK